MVSVSVILNKSLLIKVKVQTTVLPSQIVPRHPLTHPQENEVSVGSEQLPPFLHGFKSHS